MSSFYPDGLNNQGQGHNGFTYKPGQIVPGTSFGHMFALWDGARTDNWPRCRKAISIYQDINVMFETHKAGSGEMAWAINELTKDPGLLWEVPEDRRKLGVKAVRGDTLLHIAVKLHNVNLMKFLSTYADVEGTGESGKTLRREVVDACKNEDGLTARDVAAKLGADSAKFLDEALSQTGLYVPASLEAEKVKCYNKFMEKFGDAPAQMGVEKYVTMEHLGMEKYVGDSLGDGIEA
jgi:hypothetical protein